MGKMKRRSHEDEIRYQRKRAKHNLKRAERARNRRANRQQAYEYQVALVSGRAQRVKQILREKRPRFRRSPFITGVKSLSLLNPEDYRATLEIVRTMRDYASGEKRRVIVDLRECTDVKAAAVLKLHAEFEVLQALDPKAADRIKIVWPNNTRASGILSGFEFHGAPLSNGVRPGLLPIKSGITGDKVIGPLIRHMNSSLYSGKLVTTGTEWDTLYKALTESILNVQMHAYDSAERTALVTAIDKRWWLLGTTLGDQLFLALFDKGIGIPQSMRHKPTRITRVMTRFSRILMRRQGGVDSTLVKGAMLFGRSRLNTGGQGTGLTDIRNFVEQNPRGQLHIYSNFGEYEYDSATKRETLIEHPLSMHGTLIQWNVSLSTKHA